MDEIALTTAPNAAAEQEGGGLKVVARKQMCEKFLMMCARYHHGG
ncbi:MAG: hypothetical protein ABL907_19570 [Hyphomicrobium sp.]